MMRPVSTGSSRDEFLASLAAENAGTTPSVKKQILAFCNVWHVNLTTPVDARKYAIFAVLVSSVLIIVAGDIGTYLVGVRS